MEALLEVMQSMICVFDCRSLCFLLWLSVANVILVYVAGKL